jgi:hypothetical protein
MEYSLIFHEIGYQPKYKMLNKNYFNFNALMQHDLLVLAENKRSKSLILL